MLKIAIPTSRPQGVANYINALTGTGAKKEKSIREWKEHFKEMPFPDHPVSMITYPGLWIDLTTAMDDLDTRSK